MTDKATAPEPVAGESTADNGTADEATVGSDIGAGAAGSSPVHASFGAQLRSWGRRIRHGESGMLPVLVGLAIIIVIFQVKTPVFLSAGNLANLITQGAPLVLLAMAEVFVLLLGEIDLSIGFVAGIGAVVAVALSSSDVGPDWPWWLSLAAGLVATALIGVLQGLLITRFRLPSFVVTLAGLLGWQGVLLYMVNHIGGASGGTIRITNPVLNNMVNGNMTPTLGWIVLIVTIAIYGFIVIRQNLQRRASDLVTRPMTMTLVKVGAIAAAGVILVAVCNVNRGGIVPLQGVPWVVPIIIGVLIIWTFLLTRTRFGKYVYAIGGNAEAARRAGISLTGIRLAGFTLCSMTAGLAGVIYASRLGSISSNINGGQLVLFAVAAAVIGGTSLFGGRGKIVHAVVGGMIVAVIKNGMGLIGLHPAVQLIVTALVLLAAVIVDAVARRGRDAVGN